MDGPIFDAMLKTALEEALREDMKDLDSLPPVRQSRRQRKRMRKLLADPFGYERRQRTAPEQPTRRRRHIRWIAAAVIVVLLSGTAAGYALGGGAFFQRMFDESPWAVRYGGAADTEQLLDMGGTYGADVEADGLRLTVVDAVSDGQMAMISVQMTVPPELADLGPGGLCFQKLDILPLDGREKADFGYGLSIRPWPDSQDQYLLIFSITDTALEQGGSYRISMEGLGRCGEEGPEVLLPGTWELEVTLQPVSVQNYGTDHSFSVSGETWTLIRAAVSPLALTLEFQVPETAVDLRYLDTMMAPTIRMTGGEIIDRTSCVCGITSRTGRVEMTLEFQMPLDVEKIKSISVFGRELTATP